MIKRIKTSKTTHTVVNHLLTMHWTYKFTLSTSSIYPNYILMYDEFLMLGVYRG